MSYIKGDRVEIHPACDCWMQGDRYGEVTKNQHIAKDDKFAVLPEFYYIHVKLDSGKVLKFHPRNIIGKV